MQASGLRWEWGGRRGSNGLDAARYRASANIRRETIPMKLVLSAIAASPIASAFREKLVGAVGLIGAAPFVYWAAQSSQAGQGRLFSAGIFKP